MLAYSNLLHSCSFLFIDINWCTIRKGDAIRLVECFQIYFPHADAETYRHDSPQQFTMSTWIERGRREFVPALLRLSVDNSRMTHLPDNVIVSFSSEPRLQHIANTESLILTSEEAPRALQPPPEHHEAFLIIFDFDHNDLDHFDQLFTFHYSLFCTDHRRSETPVLVCASSSASAARCYGSRRHPSPPPSAASPARTRTAGPGVRR